MGIHTRNRSTQSTHTPISGAKFDQMLAVSDHSCQSQHDYKGHDCHYLRAKADGANQSARALGSVQLLRVDVVFAPAPEEVYRAGAATFVEVAGLSERLDGKSRPGHFRGVATVVAKLLIAAEPDRVFFGQKDAAQVAVLRRMVEDLGLPVELVVCPIVREPDGLAMSSRNRYLNAEERQQALVLSGAIQAAQRLAQTGEQKAAAFVEAARQVFSTQPEVRIDYIAVVDWATLEPVEVIGSATLFAVAAYLGKTRLIDNFIVGQLG